MSKATSCRPTARATSCTESMGVPLYESDTAHLYIGVDDIDEALKYFEYALAPDIAKQTSVSNNYTYTLTDTSGNSQGTVSFVPGSGTSVAEITTDLAGLKYFNKVIFLQNSAWPYNSGEGKKWKLGDVRILSIIGGRKGCDIVSRLAPADRIPRNWVLIRESGNGVTPLWVTTTISSYEMNYEVYVNNEVNYNCPNFAKAKEIYQLLHKDWAKYSSVLPHVSDVWVGERQSVGTFDKWYRYYYINLTTDGTITLRDYKDEKRPYLLQIDWMDDAPGYFYTLTGSIARHYSQQTAVNLFDNNTQTKWCSHVYDKAISEISNEECWIAEFMSEKPINPTAYYLVTGNDQSVFPDRSPRIWSIYAKENLGDAWVLIDKRDNTDYYRDRMTDEDFWTVWWGLKCRQGEVSVFPSRNVRELGCRLFPDFGVRV